MNHQQQQKFIIFPVFLLPKIKFLRLMTFSTITTTQAELKTESRRNVGNVRVHVWRGWGWGGGIERGWRKGREGERCRGRANGSWGLSDYNHATLPLGATITSSQPPTVTKTHRKKRRKKIKIKKIKKK